jgi:hypothetical protein
LSGILSHSPTQAEYQNGNEQENLPHTQPPIELDV